MDRLTSATFLESLSTYSKTSQIIQDPNLGEFSLLRNSQGSMLLKKTITKNQLSQVNIDAFEHYQRLDSPYIVQFKGFVKEQYGNPNEYAIFYEYFEETLKDEIERKACQKIRYTPQEVLHILQCVSRALAHMQAMQVVHGEVKSTNIVRVGKDYKLINPAIFGKSLPHFEITIPKYPIRSTKIISTELRNAMYRDIVDPVHEDLKDDVYALGLVALDIMILRVEAPIPVEKRLERSNVIYSNTLLRLVKKMLESVLTLRLDPIACKLYIEKIYYKILQEPCQESSQQSVNASLTDIKSITPEKSQSQLIIASEVKDHQQIESEQCNSNDKDSMRKKNRRAIDNDSQELDFLQLYEEFMNTKNDRSMLDHYGKQDADLSTTYYSRLRNKESLNESKFNTWDASRMSGDTVDNNESPSQPKNNLDIYNTEADNTPRFIGNRQNFRNFVERDQSYENSNILEQKDVNYNYVETHKKSSINLPLQLQEVKDKENRASDSYSGLDSTKNTSLGELSKTSFRTRPACEAESISIERSLDIQILQIGSEKELPRTYSIQLDQDTRRHHAGDNSRAFKSSIYSNSNQAQDYLSEPLASLRSNKMQPSLTDSYLIGSNPEVDAKLLKYINSQMYDSRIQSSRKVTERLDDGTVYEGEMTRFLRNGSGKLTYPDGKFFIGNFENGKMHGQGTLFNCDRSIICKGEWQNDKYNEDA